MTKHSFIFFKSSALLIFLFFTMAHSWECERKNVRTYLGKKNINVCFIHYSNERKALQESLGDFIEKDSNPNYFVEFITDKDLINEMIEKEPYPDSYINEVDVEWVSIVYDNQWKILSIRYQSQLYHSETGFYSQAGYISNWWDGIAFYFNKKQKVVRVHRYGQSGAFLYCTEYSKYNGKTGNWDDLDCGQIK